MTPLAESALDRFEVLPAGAVDLRRDLAVFVDFVRREGLKRGHRGNTIPKGPAAKLARVLSSAGEAAAVEARGFGHWSNAVSQLARGLGLVSFDVKGVYAGYSSQEPSFPDNEIEIDEQRFAAWLADGPLAKERAILAQLVTTSGSEFFRRAVFFREDQRFDTSGCATGPASRMDLPAIRRKLLELLADLPSGVWLPMRGLVDQVRTRAPALILDPKLRKPVEKWQAERKKLKPGQLEDLYENFRERTNADHWGREGQLGEKTPNIFERVEGRYLQFFLQEIPFLCGFVGLALEKRKPRPSDVTPAAERVQAVWLAPRLRQVVRGEPELSRVSVTVLANFEVVVEAPSYPDAQLALLAPSCVKVKEDRQIHLWRLDRKRVLELAASQPRAPKLKGQLEKLTGRPLPENVATELESWCGHAEKLTVFEGTALVELRGPEALGRIVRGELGELVLDEQLPGFLMVKNPARALSVLEQRGRVPEVAAHRADRFAAVEGHFASAAAAAAAEPPANSPPSAARKRVRLVAKDLVGYHCAHREVLEELRGALVRGGARCQVIDEEDLLVVPATELPQLRKALKRLGDRYDVELGG